MVRESFNSLKLAQFETPLGPMIAIADHQVLYRLEFLDMRGRGSCLTGPSAQNIRFKSGSELAIAAGRTSVIDLIEQELEQYFAGKLRQFTTPIKLSGTQFQQEVWQELQKIPYGATCAYLELAKAIAKPKSYRAAANANGANQFTIIIPCHRVINANGKLGGYAGGLERKIWLLEHEQQVSKTA